MEEGKRTWGQRHFSMGWGPGAGEKEVQVTG